MPPKKDKTAKTTTEDKDKTTSKEDLPEGKKKELPKRRTKINFERSMYRVAERFGSHRLSRKGMLKLDSVLVGVIDGLASTIGGTLKPMDPTGSTMLNKRDVETGVRWMYSHEDMRPLAEDAVARAQLAADTYKKSKPVVPKKPKKVAEAAK